MRAATGSVDAHAGGQVHAQADLVPGQQLLTRDLDRLHAQLDHLGAHVLLEVPEGVSPAPRRQRARQLAVDEHQARRFRRHFRDHRDLGQQAELAQTTDHGGVDLEALGERHALHLDLHQPAPVQLARTRRQHVLELAVPRHQADFVGADVGQHEVLAQLVAQARDQRIGIAAGVFRIGDVVHDHFDTLQRIEHAVHACGEHALELTVLVHQAALAVTDHDPLGPEHGTSPWLALVVRSVCYCKTHAGSWIGLHA